MARRCSTRACPSITARWRPVVVLVPPGTITEDAQLRIEFDTIVLCTPCRDEQTVADFVTDDAWQRVTHMLAMTGRVLPDRDKTRLEWNDLDTPENPS